MEKGCPGRAWSSKQCDETRKSRVGTLISTRKHSGRKGKNRKDRSPTEPAVKGIAEACRYNWGLESITIRNQPITVHRLLA